MRDLFPYNALLRKAFSCPLYSVLTCKSTHFLRLYLLYILKKCAFRFFINLLFYEMEYFLTFSTFKIERKRGQKRTEMCFKEVQLALG